MSLRGIAQNTKTTQINTGDEYPQITQINADEERTSARICVIRT